MLSHRYSSERRVAAEHRVAPDSPTAAILPFGSGYKPFPIYGILLL